MILASLSFLQAIIMGLVQGVTELFPISSLGHGVLIPALLGWHNLVGAETAKQNFFLTFLVALHVGTALGLLAYYRRTWAALFRGLFTQLGRTRDEGLSSLWRLTSPSVDAQYRLLAMLVIGTIPVGVAGVLLDHTLRKLFAKPLAAAAFLVLNGVILLVGERLRGGQGRHAQVRSVETIRPRQAFTIGFSQIFALFAGISRSGVTMVASLLNGFDHEEAANFSFLLATPVILLAGLYKLPELFGHLGHGVRSQALVGAIVAGIASWFSVRFLTRWFTTKTLRPFAIYCLVVGLLCVVRFA